nr:PREDICTED: aminopeptidase N-like isoform X1 [Linepithema humile]XP_012228394.1 PREDICTED: aminopeptidase N-like isoform X1 [Linepithema humile]
MHYEVKLTVNTELSYPWNTSIVGEVYIDVNILSTNPALILNAKNLEINSSWTRLINDQGFSIVGYHINEWENLITYFEEFVPLGRYTLCLKFKSTSQDNFYQSFFPHKLYDTLYPQYGRVILTRFGNRAARQLFPCWDKPEFIATFNITVKHSKTYMALSNTQLLRQYNDDSDDTFTIWSKFHTTPIMTTNQLVIALLPLTNIHQPNLTAPIIHTWCKTNTTFTLSFMHSIAAEVPKHLLQYTNVSPKISKIDHVIIWKAQTEAHLGIIIYCEFDVMYDKTLQDTAVKKRVAYQVAYDIALVWFSGIITPAHNLRTHSWLRRSFALFFLHYVLDQIHTEWHEMFFIVVENLHNSMREDHNIMLPVLHEINSSTNSYIRYYLYRKGSVLLRMLQHIMGEETFRKGVIKFLNRHKYRLFTTDDLWSAMQAALNATSESKVDIKKVMDTWITQKSFPLVTVTRDYVTGKTLISQQPYNTFDVSDMISNSSKWWIPVTWTTRSSLTFHETTPTLWLGPENETISIKTNPDEWIIVNLQETGYYRVYYDRTNWEQLGNYLKNKDHLSIHVLNRAQIIDDICDMFKKGEIDWALFSFVTSYLSREKNYIPWVPMLNCLDDLSVYFSFPESKQFQMYLASYFDGILNEIGYQENSKNFHDNDLSKIARLNLVSHACTLGNPTCRNTFGNKLKQYIAHPTKHQILPWWEDSTFCFGLKATNVKIWHEVFWLYMQRKNKTILDSLSCTEHTIVVIEFLNKLVNDNTLIRKRDLSDFISNVIKQHIHNHQLFSYILNEPVLFKLVPTNHIIDIILENLYDEKKLDELSVFVDVSTNNYLYDDKIEQRRQEIRDLKKSFNNIFGNKYDNLNN